jgi:hypothetical protein
MGSYHSRVPVEGLCHASERFQSFVPRPVKTVLMHGEVVLQRLKDCMILLDFGLWTLVVESVKTVPMHGEVVLQRLKDCMILSRRRSTLPCLGTISIVSKQGNK